MLDASDIMERVVEWMNDEELRQVDVAKLGGVGRGTVWQIVAGVNRNPSASFIVNLMRNSPSLRRRLLLGAKRGKRN